MLLSNALELIGNTPLIELKSIYILKLNENTVA